LLPADTSQVPVNRPVPLARDRDAPRFRPFLATPASRIAVTIAAGAVVVPCAAMTS